MTSAIWRTLAVALGAAGFVLYFVALWLTPVLGQTEKLAITGLIGMTFAVMVAATTWV